MRRNMRILSHVAITTRHFCYSYNSGPDKTIHFSQASQARPEAPEDMALCYLCIGHWRKTPVLPAKIDPGMPV
jgi:hypothetical protein